jgi:hypothetical protein
MQDDVLDALTHGVIDAVSRKEIESRQSRRMIVGNSIEWDELQEMLPKEAKPFDIEEVKDETHLREIIMERVLDAAAHNITASVKGAPHVPIADLPEDQKMEFLNKAMLELLDSNSGPGHVLRLSIAMMLINYRIRNRLKELLATLRPSSFKFKRASDGLDHLDKLIKSGMFYFESWTFFSDGPWGKKPDSDFEKQKLIESILTMKQGMAD